MRSIARLLFGPEGGRLADLFAPDGHDEGGMAARARQAGEWCQTTPGAGWPARRVGSPRPDSRGRQR
jgi:hypothetical protein